MLKMVNVIYTLSQSKDSLKNRNRLVGTVMACSCTLNSFCLCSNQWKTRSHPILVFRYAESSWSREGISWGMWKFSLLCLRPPWRWPENVPSVFWMFIPYRVQIAKKLSGIRFFVFAGPKGAAGSWRWKLGVKKAVRALDPHENEPLKPHSTQGENEDPNGENLSSKKNNITSLILVVYSLIPY